MLVSWEISDSLIAGSGLLKLFPSCTDKCSRALRLPRGKGPLSWTWTPRHAAIARSAQGFPRPFPGAQQGSAEDASTAFPRVASAAQDTCPDLSKAKQRPGGDF